MRGSMAINPQDIADENTQRSALAEKGSPTKVAEDPQKSIQIAGKLSTKNVLKLLNEAKEVETPSLPQEKELILDDGTYSETRLKKKSSKKLLSKEGQKKFKEQGFSAKPNEGIEIIKKAEQALTDEEKLAQQNVQNIKTQSKNALTADEKSFDLATGNVVDEGKADEALDLINATDASIERLKATTADNNGDFNFDYMNTGDDINKTITALSQVYKDETQIVKRGQATNAVTIERAAERMQNEVGFTRNTVFARKDGQTWNAEEFTAARELLVRSAVKLTDLATKLKNGGANNADGVFEPATDLDRLAFRRQMAIHAAIQLQLKGAQTEAARALQSFKINVGGEESAVRQAQEAKRLIDEAGGLGITDNMARRFLDVQASRGLAGVNQMARGGWVARTRQAVADMYLAGLLSNTATQVRNIVGTASFMAYQLPVEAIAGVFGTLNRQSQLFLYPETKFTTEQVEIDDFLMRLKGYSDAFVDALRVANVAFKTNKPAGASKLDLERYNAVTGASDSYFGKAIDYVGNISGVSFKLLLGGDEFFKTISQRGEFNVKVNRAYKNALRNGATEAEARDAAAMVILDPGSVADDVIEKSKFDTLQSDTGKLGKFSRELQDVKLGFIPVGRYMLPFATAPTNDMLRSAEMIPFLTILGENTQRTLKGENGAAAAQMAYARYTFSALMMYQVSQFAMNGQITGAMPQDPKVREKLPKGWQPWSIVYKGDNWPTDENGNDLPLYDMYGSPNGTLKYFSYNGFGAVSTVIGITADTVQRAHVIDDPSLRNNIFTAAAASVYHYYKDLPMLEGMSNFVSVFSDSGGNLNFDPTKLFKSPAEATSIVGFPNPYSSLQNALVRAKEGSGIKDARENLVYYTEQDILQQNEDETFVYALADGRPNYSLIGQVKRKELLPEAARVIGLLDAYQAKNSLFRNDEDKYATRYDTLGRPLGDEDTNIYVRPVRAIFNAVSGFRISEAQPVEDYEKELMRLSMAVGGWPLSNPKTKSGVRLSRGVQSDWVNLAKNKIELDIPGLGRVNYRDMLRAVLTDTSNRYGAKYEMLDDVDRKQFINNMVEKRFRDAAWTQLMQDPKYANLNRTIFDLENARKEGRIE